MKTPAEIVADALRPLPPLWLHRVSENQWRVCHWEDDIEGRKSKSVVVAEACNYYEAYQKRDRIRDQRAGATVIAALEASGWRLVHLEAITEEMIAEMAECYDPGWRYSGAGVSISWAENSFKAAVAAAPKWSKGSEE